MGRIIKSFLWLAAFGLAALTLYAYLGDYRPEPQEISQPVTLDVN